MRKEFRFNIEMTQRPTPERCKKIYECSGCSAKSEAGSEDLLNNWMKSGIIYDFGEFAPDSDLWCPKCWQEKVGLK